MMRRVKVKKLYKALCFLNVLLIVLALFITSGFNYVSAALNSCSATFSPNSTPPNSNVSGVLGISNTSDTAINWIKLTSPGTEYAVISSASAYMWDANASAQEVIFSSGSLNEGASQNFSIEFSSGDPQPSPVNWTVQVSNNPDGSDSITCDGDLSLGIVVQPSQINISDISVSSISSSSVTIKWNTDVASTSKVEYGLDDSYGKSISSASLTTTHTVTINGLAANTGYRYRVISATPADGGEAISGDNIFLTAIKETTESGSNQPLPLSPGFKITDPGDKTPPSISFTTKLTSKVFTTTPTFSGTASDDKAVARVEYSIDNGRNWLNASPLNTVTGKSTTFSFTPKNLDDGDYQILARAIDGGGNITKTPTLSIVVDRLPPLIGGNLISIGPQSLQPDINGRLTTLTGVDQKIIVSATGGPTTINLIAKNTDGTEGNFALTKSEDTGLWVGILNFDKSGNYLLSANSVDGAGNKTSRVLADIKVVPSPRILTTDNGKTSDVKNAKVTLYYLDADTHSWVVWDGAPNGQTNPSYTDNKGAYQYLMPGGTYYLKAEAKGYKTVISKRFKLDSPQSLTADIYLKKNIGFSIRSFNIAMPTLWPELVDMNLDKRKVDAPRSSNGSLPQFTLPDLEGKNFNSLQLLGRPTVITVLSTWSPPSQEQLAAIAKVPDSKDYRVMPILVQEKQQKIKAYASIAGYEFTMLADSDGQLVEKLKINSLPTHYFIDRKGSIIKVMVGVLNNKQLLNELTGSQQINQRGF